MSKNQYTLLNPAVISHYLIITSEPDFAFFSNIDRATCVVKSIHLAETCSNISLLDPFFLFFSLGDGEGSMPLSWTTLNPMTLVQQMKSFNFEFDSFEEFMKMVSFGKVVNALCKFWMSIEPQNLWFVYIRNVLKWSWVVLRGFLDAICSWCVGKTTVQLLLLSFKSSFRRLNSSF